jgi:DNA-binding CsgD family transcriptional regulator
MDMTPTESTTERLLRAVNAIYEAAAAPDCWPAALQAAADVFGDVGANLTFAQHEGNHIPIVSPSLASGIADYNTKWWRHDIRTQRALARGLFMLTNEVVSDLDILSLDEVETHPFYTEFLASFDIKWFASVMISPSPDIAAGLTIQRSGSKPSFSPEEKATLQILGRHAERALRLGIQLIDADVTNDNLQAILARLGLGVLLLNGEGEIILANAEAQRLIDEGSLAIARQQLVLNGPAERRQFNEMVEAMVAGGPDLVPGPRPLLLQQPDMQRSLVAYLLPARSRTGHAAYEALAQVKVIMLVIDPRTHQTPDPALVRDLLGLTLGEARVAALVASGKRPREASAALGVSEETVRTVLKRVFSKVGVSRQSELTTLVSKMTIGPGRSF